jgi:pilus assembly protein CpaE
MTFGGVSQHQSGSKARSNREEDTVLHRLTIDAFTLTHDTAESALGLKNLPKFTRSTINHQSGGLQAAIRHYIDHPSAEVIIVEDDGDLHQLQARLEQLSEVVEPGRKLIVVGAINDIGFYRRIVSLGVADYLLSPAEIEDLAASVERVSHDPQRPTRGRLLSFMGARGGVGCSTIAQNVAWILSTEFKQRVILVDLDLTYGTCALAFNEEPKQPLSDALTDPQRLDQVLLQRFMVGEDDKLQILSTNGVLRSNLLPSNAAIEKLVDLSRQMADVIILDLPHIWNSWVEEFAVTADESVLVACLDLPNLREAKNLLDHLKNKRGDGRDPRLVINKADMAKRGRLTVQDATRALPVKPVVTLPFDPTAFVEAINDGKAIAERSKTHKASLALRSLTAQIGGVSLNAPSRRALSLPTWLKRSGDRSAKA